MDKQEMGSNLFYVLQAVDPVLTNYFNKLCKLMGYKLMARLNEVHVCVLKSLDLSMQKILVDTCYRLSPQECTDFSAKCLASFFVRLCVN